MPHLSHSFSIENALASSQETYDLDFADWGFRSDPLKPNENVRFPSPGKSAIPTTLAGLSIGPKSTVDRCWVSWDRQRNLTIPNDTDSGLVTSPLRRLSLGSPLTYSQATNVGTLVPGVDIAVNAAMQRGLLYVFAHAFGMGEPPTPFSYDLGYFGDTTILPETYVDQFGVIRQFKGSGGFDFEAPFLHLVLNLRPPRFSPPTERFPLMRTNTTSVLLANPKTRVAMIPIFGRKHVRVQVVSRTSGPVMGRTSDFWLGLVRNLNESKTAAPNDFSPVFEINAGTALGLAPDVPASFSLDNPCADYLAIYNTTTIGNNHLMYTVVAYD
jgi:hypothetical protein